MTLASSLPKVGLESVLTKRYEHKFDFHSEDDDFHAHEYWFKELLDIAKQPSHQKDVYALTQTRLAQQCNRLEELLNSIDSVFSKKAKKTEQEKIQCLLKVLGCGGADQYKGVLRAIEDQGLMDQFEARLGKKTKWSKSIYNHTLKDEFKKTKSLCSIKTIYKPWRIRKSKLFYPEGVYAKEVRKKQLNHDEVLKGREQQAAEAVACDVLKDYLVLRMRAMQNACYDGLDILHSS